MLLPNLRAIFRLIIRSASAKQTFHWGPYAQPTKMMEAELCLLLYVAPVNRTQVRSANISIILQLGINVLVYTIINKDQIMSCRKCFHCMYTQNKTGIPHTCKVKKCDVTFMQPSNVGTFKK
jgi:hypothetical protein